MNIMAGEEFGHADIGGAGRAHQRSHRRTGGSDCPLQEQCSSVETMGMQSDNVNGRGGIHMDCPTACKRWRLRVSESLANAPYSPAGERISAVIAAGDVIKPSKVEMFRQLVYLCSCVHN